MNYARTADKQRKATVKPLELLCPCKSGVPQLQRHVANEHVYALLRQSLDGFVPCCAKTLLKAKKVTGVQRARTCLAADRMAC